MKTIMSFGITCYMLVAVSCLIGQVPDWEWMRDPLEKRQQTRDMCTAYDNNGNTYSAGMVTDLAIFGDQVLDLDEGESYRYIWKLNAAGNTVWLKPFNYQSCTVIDLDTDSVGNLYVLARYSGTVDIEGHHLHTIWNYDLFVAKLNTNGDFMWLSEAGGLASFVAKLKVTSSGVSYVTGEFTGNISIAGQQYSTASWDVFLARIDSSGTWTWSRQVTGVGDEYVYGMDVDSLGNCYLSGNAGDLIHFGPINIPYVGYMATVYVAKCSSSGTWLWAKSIYPDSPTYFFGGVWDLAATSMGSCYLAHYEYISGSEKIFKISYFDAAGRDSIVYSFTGALNCEGLEIDSGNNLYLYCSHFQPVSFGNYSFDDWLGTIFVKFNANGQVMWAVEPSNGFIDNGQYVVAANGTATLGVFRTGPTSLGEFYCSPSTASSIYIFRLSNTGQPLWMKTNWLNSIRSEVKGLDVDGDLNIYITGEFEGDTYIADQYLPNHSSRDKDIYVAKLSPQGEWLWAVSVGGSGLDEVADISVGSGSNPYIAGHFSGQVDFGGTILTSEGETDIFVAKLDTNGNWLWAKRAGGTGVDKAEDLYMLSSTYPGITGSFNGTADFGDVTLQSAGLEDAFVWSIYPDGTWNNAFRAGGAFSDVGTALFGSDSYIFLGGNFYQEIPFGSTTLVSAGGTDVFVALLNPQHNWEWANKAGGPGNDEQNAMDWCSWGGLFIAGGFRETAQFGNSLVFSRGDSDIYAARMSAQGDWLWVSSAGGTGSDAATSITENQNSVLIGGWTTGETFFGGNSLAGMGAKDIAIAELDMLTGNWVWNKRSGGYQDECSTKIVSDPCNRIIVSGYYETHGLNNLYNLVPQGAGQGFFGYLNRALELDEPSLVPSLSQIESVYPNPFNPLTNINYKLSQTGKTTLAVYNLKGQKVKSLVNQVNSAGKHDTVWDGTDDSEKAVSSGIYFLYLEHGSQIDTRKLMLMK